MATFTQKIQCEAEVRELLEKQGLPAPDEVEYGAGCIRLLFNETKTVLVVDIDNYTEVDTAARCERGEISDNEIWLEPEDDPRKPPLTVFPTPGPAQRN